MYTVAMRKLATTKNAAIDPVTALLGAGSVAAGAVAVNDIYKSWGLSRDQRGVQRAISSKRAIDVAEYVRKIDPKIKVIDTIAKAKALVKDEIKHPITRALALMELSQLVTMGNNAGALRGKLGEYLICAGKLPQEIIDHEIGHLLDFRAKGLTFDKQGPYKTGFLQSIWRPTYNRQVMAAEQAAWARAPESKHKDKTQRQALGTYDKGFHASRLQIAFPLAGALGLYAIGRHLEKSAETDQERAKTRFKKLRGALDAEGVMIGAHKRVAIPKSALSERDLTHHLGFVPVRIAIPEQGQKRLTSFRHEKHNFHIHDHDTHWTMHRDEHPAATMVIRRMLNKSKAKAGQGASSAGGKAKGIGHAIAERARIAGKVGKALVRGVPHVVTEGVPGAYYYAKGKVTGAGSTLHTVLGKEHGRFKRRVSRWRPTRTQDKTATAVVQDYAARAHIDATRQLKARMTQMRPAINTSTFRALRPQKPTVARPAASALRSASSGLGQAIKGALK